MALDIIHARLGAGAAPDVTAVLSSDGNWVVRWGVACAAHLDETPTHARALADVMDGEGYMPALPPLLRAAADVCDAKTATLQ